MADPGRAIERLIDLMRAGVRTSVVGKIISYQAGAASAEVQFMVQETRQLPDGPQVVPPITVAGAPVIWIIGGGRAFTMGLREGDLVMVFYRHRSHDKIDSGVEGPLSPTKCRRMNPSDVVVMPGFVAPDTGLPAGSFREDGQPVLFMPTGESFRAGDASAEFTLCRTDLVMNELQAIHSAVSGHEHTYIPSSGAPLTPIPTTAGPIFAPPADVGTTRVKVDE